MINLKKVLLFLILTMAIVSPVYAYSQETCDANAYYRHPVNGIVEDPANNEGLGTGMCQNVLHDKGLIEDINGEYFLSFRLKMTDNMKDEKFSVQKRGDELYIPLDYQVLNETETTKDYRIKLPAKDAIVRAEIFIVPMGRSVIFFMDFDEFISGNTDFITIGENGKLENLVKSEPQMLNKDKSSVIEEGAFGYKHGLLMKDSPEIRSIYKGVEASSELEIEDVEEYAELGSVSKTFINVFIIIFSLIIFFIWLAVVIIHFWTKALKELNYQREVSLDEKI